MFNILRVNPIIEYPPCIKKGGIQDCISCIIAKKHGSCNTIRGLCIKPYYAHKKGCPNYNKRKDCPPNVKMLDEYFDLEAPFYFIIYQFHLHEHIEKMKKKHPKWTSKQLSCCLYWQGNVRKKLREAVNLFLEEYIDYDYAISYTPEAMGVDVSKTLNKYNINLDWPPSKFIYKVALAGVLKADVEYNDIFQRKD